MEIGYLAPTLPVPTAPRGGARNVSGRTPWVCIFQPVPTGRSSPKGTVKTLDLTGSFSKCFSPSCDPTACRASEEHLHCPVGWQCRGRTCRPIEVGAFLK